MEGAGETYGREEGARETGGREEGARETGGREEGISPGLASINTEACGNATCASKGGAAPPPPPSPAPPPHIDTTEFEEFARVKGVAEGERPGKGECAR